MDYMYKIPVGLGGYDGTLSPSRTGFDSRAGRFLKENIF